MRPKILNSSHQNLIKFLFVVSLLIAVIAVNILSHVLVETYTLKLDLTENSLYEFSPQTIQAAQSLSTPMKITVFNREEDFVFMLREVLKRYSALSRQIILEFVDPFENPILVDYYAQRGVQVHSDDIVIEGTIRTKVFKIQDMYSFSAGKTEITGLNAEQQLTTTLYFVNDNNIPKVAFTDGHNERPSNSLLKLFSDNHYEISRGSMSNVLRENPDIVIIAAPSRDFLKEDMKLLDFYMNQGGNVMVFIEPSLEKMKNLEEFLGAWGIIPGPELVFEERAFTGNNPVNIVPMYGVHEINRYFLENRVFLTMPSTRSLYKTARPGSAYDVRTVLNSTPESYGKRGYQFDQLTKMETDTEGPFSLIISSEKEIDTIGGNNKSRLLVAGSRSIFADDLIGFSSYGNADFIVQAINWLNAREVSILIPPRKIKSDPINILFNQALILGILISVILPLLFITSGLTVYIKRKKL